VVHSDSPNLGDVSPHLCNFERIRSSVRLLIWTSEDTDHRHLTSTCIPECRRRQTYGISHGWEDRYTVWSHPPESFFYYFFLRLVHWDSSWCLFPVLGGDPFYGFLQHYIPRLVWDINTGGPQFLMVFHPRSSRDTSLRRCIRISILEMSAGPVLHGSTVSIGGEDLCGLLIGLRTCDVYDRVPV
jgi:hypothetical protein